MSDSLPLFQRERVTLDGYTPKFNEQEILLGYRVTLHQISGEGMFRGFGAFDEDDARYQGPAMFEHTHYITVAGHEFSGPIGCVSGPNDAVVQLANWFLSYKPFKEKYPEAWQFLAENGHDLSESNRYWAVVRHQREIAKKKAQIEELQRTIARAEWIAQVNIYEVLEGRKLTEQERSQVYAEFTGVTGS